MSSIYIRIKTTKSIEHSIRSTQGGARCPSRALESHPRLQRVPMRLPRAPQEPPRRPCEATKGPPGGPKKPWELPGGSHKALQGPPRPPKRPPGGGTRPPRDSQEASGSPGRSSRTRKKQFLHTPVSSQIAEQKNMRKQR